MTDKEFAILMLKSPLFQKLASEKCKELIKQLVKEQ